MSAKVSFLTFSIQDFDLVMAYTRTRGYAYSVLVIFNFPVISTGQMLDCPAKVGEQEHFTLAR